MSDDVLIRVDGVSKKFCRDLKRSLWYGVRDTASDLLGRDSAEQELRVDEFWAVDDVSFELRRGECLGLIGRNGAGKTTLLKMLNGLIKPDRGRIEMRGRVGALIALGAGFNPILTGRENVYVNGAVLGLNRKEIDAKFEEILEFAEIDEFIDAPVQSYSSGMQVRLGFAIATALQPDVLLLDEVLAVGDATFQAKCYHRIGEVLKAAAVVLVSHNPYHIQKICDWAIILKNGRCLGSGKPAEMLALYEDVTPHAAETSTIITGNDVNRVYIEITNAKLTTGSFLELKLSLDVHSEIPCDQAYMNIVDSAGNVHAQIILDDLARMTFQPGLTEVLLRVGPLHLSRGTFQCHLLMWTAGGKQTLAQLRNSVSFDNIGPISLGPYYYPPASATVTRRSHRHITLSPISLVGS